MIIYLLTNTATGKFYVGQTRQRLAKRVGQHRRGNSVLSHAIRKHGIEAFTVETLEQCRDDADLDMAERFWMGVYDSLSPRGYNLQTGGHDRPRVHPDTRAKISASSMGHETTAETRAKISSARLGVRNTPEQNEKIRLGNLGKKIPQDAIDKSIANRKPMSHAERQRLVMWRRSHGVLTWEKVDQIRVARLAGRTLQTIADEYAISLGMVSMIVNNKRWAKESREIS